jgi:hypothetical protein
MDYPQNLMLGVLEMKQASIAEAQAYLSAFRPSKDEGLV